ncbi:MAG TPA: hypothetical protein VNE16_13745 [Vicinamibacterales bacterium]|nr:hypothetical protein [Vicinamibacterales bacterium]
MPVLHRPRVSAIVPLWSIAGGRLDIHGADFQVTAERLPDVRLGDLPARVVYASPSVLGVRVPDGLEGGRTPVRIVEVPGETAFVEIGKPVATGIHQVDSPVIDAHGNLYVTYSGTRGEEVPVSVYRVGPDGTRETFASGIVNPTSMAFDRAGLLYVSSRFDGTVYRVGPDGRAEVFVSDMGVACGLAFAADDTLYVGDRSGTIFVVTPAGEARPFASLPPSVAAFHLAVGPDRALYVTAPTLAAYDHVYRVDPDGTVTPLPQRFGRPQGLAFDAQGALYVVDALAGASGVYRIVAGQPAELVVAGPGLVGLALDPRGGLIVVSNDAAYRLQVPLRPPA